MSDFLPESNSRMKNDTEILHKDDRVSSVISGEAKIRKKSLGSKIADIFMPEDIHRVKDQIWNDIIVPGTKNAIHDAVDSFLFGGGYPRSNSRRNYYDNPSYKRPYSSIGREKDYVEAREYRSVDEYNDIVVQSRGDGERVIFEMEQVFDRYKVVRVSDLYSACGIRNYPYTANNWGWTDIYAIRSFKTVRVRDGYLIQTARAIPIDD